MQSTRRTDDHVATLRRHWPLLLGTVALGTLVGAAAWFVVPSTYVSYAAVQVHALGEDVNPGESTGRTNGDVNLDTEAQIATSTVVLSGALELLEADGDASDPAALVDLRDSIEVTVPPNSTVLEIGVSASTAGQARRAAEAVVDSYLTHRSERVGGAIDARLDSLSAELEAKYTEVEELADEVAGSSGAEQLRAEARLATATEEAAALNAEGTPLRAARGTLNPGTVITPAELPDDPSSPVTELWLVGGALLGLAAGVAASFWWDRSRSRGRTRHRKESTPHRDAARPTPGSAPGGGSGPDAAPRSRSSGPEQRARAAGSAPRTSEVR